ncbi:DUF2332 domain-containing protein [Kribbella sindirgiensis]|uniref:DUF2332 domain-containing protein n=1 Tax=Kribbella sindirgiensis TaxID=1124744 RepID=A0A4R0IA72_9ACTN|nr:DUF2332 domain-containing protein [Kribbella sindirgiensis]TCC29189.1 DUF2332 domain-containing protein [Kribbella sindirgiensis]
MPDVTGGSAKSGARAGGLAQVYRRFGEGDALKTSPLYARMAIALSESPEALRVIENAPSRRRHPTVILAALHDLALSGDAPDLATAITAATAATATSISTSTSAGPSAATATSASSVPVGRDVAGLELVGAVGVGVVLRDGELVLEVGGRRKVRGDEGGRHAVLYPAVAEVARRVGAGSVGLIDVGRPAGLNLTVDRVGILYSNGQTLGVAGSAVQVPASIVGEGLVPLRAMPEVAARVVVDVEPIDVTAVDEARWLRACVPPDQVERLARLEAELALAEAAPPVLIRGGVVEVLPEAIASVPDDVLPVVITTWALSGLDLEGRLRFLQRLDEAATRRPVAWVSVEGVGVAPGMPTFGDRRASGHSIVGLGVFDHTSLHATGVGRCWLRGEMLAWLANP